MTDAECVGFLQWALPQLGLRWPGFRKVRRQVHKRLNLRLGALGLAGIACCLTGLTSESTRCDDPNTWTNSCLLVTTVMKKRLRKKKHVGEFVEWGVSIVIVREQKNDFGRFLDDFIEQAVEGNGCYFGGGGREDGLEGVIELGKTCDGPEERLKRIMSWLDAQEDVQRYAVGKVVDLWHGPFEEIDC